MPQFIPLVVTAITTVTSAVVAAGPLAVAAFNAINVIGAGMLANEAFKAFQPTVKSSGSAIEWTADPNAPNRFPFGRVGGAGNIIHNATYGPDEMYVGFVGVLGASGPINRYLGFKADDVSVTFDASGKANSSYYANVMWLDRLRGEQPETRALASPSGLKSNVRMPDWGSTYQLSGKAAFMYTLAENSKRSAYRGKVPTGIHTFEGLLCYDPRKDSTYPGGSGPCRLDDPRTWIYSINGPIHALNWNIGRWEGLTAGAPGAPYASMKVGGIGARPDGIDFEGYVEAANVFDANAWASAGWPDADQGKAAVLDSFLQASGAIYAERKGRISCMHRAAPRTSILTITADDTAGTIEYDTTTSLLERINTIRPQYWSEQHGWTMVATDEVTANAWRIEDGQGVAVTKSKGLDYNYVPGSKQARELAALQIAHTREGIRGTAPLRHYLDLEVGDCFTFQVPEAVLNGQKCIVLNVDPDLENDTITVTFASESDEKYPFAFGQTDKPPPAPSLVPSDPTYVSPPNPEDWVIEVRPPSAGGVQVPGFDLSGAVGNSTATAVQVEWWMVPQGADPNTPPGPDQEDEWVQAGIWPPTTKTIPIDVPPGRSFWIGLSYIRGQNTSARTLDGPRLSPGLVSGDVVPTAPALRPLLDGLGRVPGLLEDQWKNALNILEEVIGRREIDRTDREAAIKRDDVIGNDLVRTKETLEVAVNGTVALIETERQARITAISAEATTRNNQVVALGQSIAGVESSVSTVATNLSAETNVRTLQFSQTTTSMAVIDTRSQTTATDLASETSLRTLQYSQTKDSIAVIDTRSQTTATNLSAETSTRQTQISSLNGNLAIIDTRSQTTVNDVLALSSTTTTLSSEFGSFKSVATSQLTALANADSAQTTRLDLIAATVGSNGTAITNLQTALTTETDTRGQADITIQSDYNGKLANVNLQLSTLSSAQSQQATLIGQVQTTAGTASASATLALESINGNTAYASLQTDVNGALTGVRVNGVTRGVQLLAEYMSLEGSSQIMVLRNNGLLIWAGSKSVSPGARTWDNGTLGIDDQGNAWFGGKTYSGPFDSGAASATAIALPKNTWTTVASVLDKRMLPDGDLIGRVSFDVNVTGAPDPNMDYTVEYRIAVANADGSGPVSVVSNFGGFPTNVWTSVFTYLEGHATTTRGTKRLLLQVNPSGSTISTAQARNGRLRGLYGA